MVAAHIFAPNAKNRRYMKNIIAVILAAGKGMRMGVANCPKVMYEANGKPMVEYLIKNVRKIGRAHV